MGLDTKAFNDCFDSGKYTQLIQNQTSIGHQLQVQSTPTFAVNGQGVVGAQTFDYFKQMIDAILTPSPTP